MTYVYRDPTEYDPNAHLTAKVCRACSAYGLALMDGVCGSCVALARRRTVEMTPLIIIGERPQSARPVFLEQLPTPAKPKPTPAPKHPTDAHEARKTERRRAKRAAANPRICRKCQAPLPADAGPQRRYCDGCASPVARKGRNHYHRYHTADGVRPVPADTLRRPGAPEPTRRIAVLAYARDHGGMVDVPSAALALGRARTNIRAALKDLGAVKVDVNLFEVHALVLREGAS